MEPGDTVSVGGYVFRFNGVRQERGANYRALVGDVDLLSDGRLLRKMAPEKRFYLASAMPMTEAAIDTGFLRDVYVSLGEPIDKSRPEAAWAVRVYYKPFVDWIWGGCILMALGGVLALSDRRYRIRARTRLPAGALPVANA
jgi:cytochrome c-type biogenesis protein CcmF